MTDVKISQLPPAATPLSGNEVLPIVQNNVTVQTAVSSLFSGASINVNTFTGTGSTTLFNLSSNPGSKNNTTVYINGIYQNKSSYSISGLNLIFTQAPPYTSLIEVSYA